MHRTANDEPKRLGQFFRDVYFLYRGSLTLIFTPKYCSAHPVLRVKTRIKLNKWGETRDVISCSFLF